MGFGEHSTDEAFSVVCPFEGLFLTTTGGFSAPSNWRVSIRMRRLCRMPPGWR